MDLDSISVTPSELAQEISKEEPLYPLVDANKDYCYLKTVVITMYHSHLISQNL